MSDRKGNLWLLLESSDDLDDPKLLYKVGRQIDMCGVLNRQLCKLVEYAAQRGSLKMVCKLLDCIPSVGRTNAPKIWKAAYIRVCDSTVYELLIDAGHSVDDSIDTGQTALHCAAELNDPQFVETLIRLGASVDIIEKWGGKTALLYAFKSATCAVRLRDTVSVLLKSGADPNLRGASHFPSALRNAIFFALGRSHTWNWESLPTDIKPYREMLQSLLDHGADLYDRFYLSHSVTHTAFSMTKSLPKCAEIYALLLAAHKKHLHETLVNICLILKPLDLPVLVVLEIYDLAVQRCIAVAKVQLKQYKKWALAMSLKHAADD